MIKKENCCQRADFSKEDFENVCTFLKIIHEPHRLKILFLLREGERCVCDIWRELNLSQNLTSHHLKTMKDFGILISRQEGRKVLYCLNKKIIQKYAQLFNTFLTFHL